MRRLGLGDLPVRLGFGGVDEVGELDAVLDEEHRHVVADQIPVAFARVEADREAADIPGGVRGASRAGHRGEPDEHRCLDRGVAQDRGARQVLDGRRQAERAVSRGAAGVNDPFGDALMVEMHDLLTQMEIVEQSRAPLADPEAVVRVIHRNPSSRREGLTALRPCRGDYLTRRPQRPGRPPPPRSRSRWTCHDASLRQPVRARRPLLPTRIPGRHAQCCQDCRSP